MLKVVAWYDNEWGYSNRLIEVVSDVGKLLNKDAVPINTPTSTSTLPPQPNATPEESTPPSPTPTTAVPTQTTDEPSVPASTPESNPTTIPIQETEPAPASTVETYLMSQDNLHQ